MRKTNLPAANLGAGHCFFTVFWIVAVLGLASDPARADFTTIINAPPTTVSSGTGLNSNTQLNVSAGGSVGNGVRAGSATSTNVEVNISGGTVGTSFQAQHNATVNITGGTVGTSVVAGISNDANNNVNVNISGGTVGDSMTINRASTVTVSGGTVGKQVTVNLGGHLVISGGSVGASLFTNSGSVLDISGGTVDTGLRVSGTLNMSGGVTVGGISMNGATLNISGGSIFGVTNNGINFSSAKYFGGDWRLNGVPISQLQNAGDTYSPVWTSTDTVSGVLSDGTPVVITPSGGVTLTTTALPAVRPAVLHAPGDTLGLGIRGGQTLIVDSGGTVPGNFNASWGTAIQVHAGGSIGSRLQTAGTAVTVDGGTIGGGFVAFGGTNVQLSSGTISGMTLFGTSTFNMSGGTASFSTANGSTASVSGGIPTFTTSAGSHVDLFGGEMRLDGVPISGLDQQGNSVPINVPSGSILSGTLADGKPFMYSSLFSNTITNGTVTLHAMAPPPIAAAPILASAGSVPYGIRTGETLIVDSGGNVPNGFRASFGSSIEIRAGGAMGQSLRAIGTNLRMTGGTLGTSATMWAGSTVRIEGGTVGSSFVTHGGTVEIVGGTVSGMSAMDGTAVTVSGGTITSLSLDHSSINITGGNFGSNDVDLKSSTANVSGAANVELFLTGQSTVNLSAGTLQYPNIWDQGVINMTGGTLNQPSFTSDSSVLNMSGGTLTGLVYNYGTLNISGGTMRTAYWSSNNGGKLNLYGAEMRFNGVPIAGLVNPGDTADVNVSGGGLLSGVLSDGTGFLLPSSGTIVDGTITVHAAAIPDVPTQINVPGSSVPTTIRSGQTMVVGAGGSVANYFLAGWGSTVNVQPGGSVGYMSAIGARVNNDGGTMASLDAYRGTTFNMTRGALTGLLNPHDGSVVNLAGGALTASIQTDAGSVVNMMDGFVGGTYSVFVVKGTANSSGGSFTGEYLVDSGGVANISGGVVDSEFDATSGSAVNFFGTQFRINGAVVPGLTVGTPLVITGRDKTLTGILMDGTPFSIALNSTDQSGADSFSPTGTLTLYLLAPTLAGDFNSDGAVNMNDYVVWRKMQNTTVARGKNGDANYDGQVTEADYMIWRAHAARSAGVGSGAAIPEPAGTLLVMIGLLCAGARRYSPRVRARR